MYRYLYNVAFDLANATVVVRVEKTLDVSRERGYAVEQTRRREAAGAAGSPHEPM
jgi:hypothetical protein